VPSESFWELHKVEAESACGDRNLIFSCILGEHGEDHLDDEGNIDDSVPGNVSITDGLSCRRGDLIDLSFQLLLLEMVFVVSLRLLLHIFLFSFAESDSSLSGDVGEEDEWVA